MGRHLAVYHSFCRKLATIVRVCCSIYVETAIFCANIARCIKYLTVFMCVLRIL